MSLLRFNFAVTYRPEKQQGLSDALSRRSYLAPKVGEEAFDQQCTTLLKPEKFKICTVIVSIDTDFLDRVRAATIEDSVACDIKQRANHDNFKVGRDLLYFEERLYVPKGPT